MATSIPSLAEHAPCEAAAGARYADVGPLRQRRLHPPRADAAAPSVHGPAAPTSDRYGHVIDGTTFPTPRSPGA